MAFLSRMSAATDTGGGCELLWSRYETSLSLHWEDAMREIKGQVSDEKCQEYNSLFKEFLQKEQEAAELDYPEADSYIKQSIVHQRTEFRLWNNIKTDLMRTTNITEHCTLDWFLWDSTVGEPILSYHGLRSYDDIITNDVITNEECRRYNSVFDELYREEEEAVELEFPEKSSGQRWFTAVQRTRDRLWEIIRTDHRWGVEEKEREEKAPEREEMEIKQWTVYVVIVKMFQIGFAFIALMMELYFVIEAIETAVGNPLEIEPVNLMKIGVGHIVIVNLLPLIHFVSYEYLVMMIQVIMSVIGVMLIVAGLIRKHRERIRIQRERNRVQRLRSELPWFLSLVPFSEIQQNDDINECPVCREKFIGHNEVCKTSCGHYFHRQCIVDCIIAFPKNECPVCRQNMRTATDHHAHGD